MKNERGKLRKTKTTIKIVATKSLTKIYVNNNKITITNKTNDNEKQKHLKASSKNASKKA